MDGNRKDHAHTVLITGGLGYIGSHTAVALVQSGFRVVILDNLSNSTLQQRDRIASIVGFLPEVHVHDVRDVAALDQLFRRHTFDAVIHFAGLKAVGESVARPLDYYDVNLTGTVALARVMDTHGVKRLVFSSSATVYGDPLQLPISESHPLQPCNPYGRTKLGAERVLEDLCASDSRWSVAALRYFNPAGAHPSGKIGEDPRGIPNNLLPYVGQVACGLREMVHIFGDDYPTPDGTAIRDYVHVMDLADAHVRALGAVISGAGFHAVNLGTGAGHSVLDVINAYQKAANRPIRQSRTARRAGDACICYADPAAALQWLGWRARHDLNQMCADAWNFQKYAMVALSSSDALAA